MICKGPRVKRNRYIFLSVRCNVTRVFHYKENARRRGEANIGEGTQPLMLELGRGNSRGDGHPRTRKEHQHYQAEQQGRGCPSKASPVFQSNKLGGSAGGSMWIWQTSKRTTWRNETMSAGKCSLTFPIRQGDHTAGHARHVEF